MKPKISLLERALFDALNPIFKSEGLSISLRSPQKENNLTGKRGILTIKDVGADNIEGRTVNTHIINPLFSFVVYTTSHVLCRYYNELLVETFESMAKRELSMDGQSVDHFYLENRFAPTLDAQSELYVSAIDIRFHLSRNI